MVNIADILNTDGRFTKLLSACEAADLLEIIAGPGPLTVLAPTDAAFAALPRGAVDRLLNDIPSLRGLLLYHILPGRIAGDELATSAEVQTALGEPLSVMFERATVKFGGARVLGAHIQASNGFVHVIDKVLMPAGICS
jgi:uncharacterized surface protein with fasciclin (FAS1) repeats